MVYGSHPACRPPIHDRCYTPSCNNPCGTALRSPPSSLRHARRCILPRAPGPVRYRDDKNGADASGASQKPTPASGSLPVPSAPPSKPVPKQAAVDGNEATARIAYALSDVSFIYPITPATPMGEAVDQWAAEGRKNVFGNVVQVWRLAANTHAGCHVACAPSCTACMLYCSLIMALVCLHAACHTACMCMAHRIAGSHHHTMHAGLLQGPCTCMCTCIAWHARMHRLACL